MGLDPLVEDSFGYSAYKENIFVDNQSQVMALHQLSLSQGVYDEVESENLAWVIRRMMVAPHVFDSIVTNIFPDFYQWPLKTRISSLPFSFRFTNFRYEMVARLFRPHGGFHADDLLHEIEGWYADVAGGTILQLAAAAYFRVGTSLFPISFPEDSTLASEDHRHEQLRLLLHDIIAVSAYSDLSATGHSGRTTALLDGIETSARRVMRSWIRSGQAYNANEHRFAKRHAQQIMRDWLMELREVGKDLEVFGQAELIALRDSGGARSGWKGFTVGPRPEDWHLIWEWDPDVEELVGDFWEWIENPPLAMPGSWVDDDDDLDWRQGWERG